MIEIIKEHKKRGRPKKSHKQEITSQKLETLVDETIAQNYKALNGEVLGVTASEGDFLIGKASNSQVPHVLSLLGSSLTSTYEEWHTQDFSKFKDRRARELIRVIFDLDPICSNALFTLIRVADTDHYFLVKKRNGSEYKEGQSAIQNFIKEIENPQRDGFIEHFSLGQVKRQMVQSLFTQGAVDCLLSVNKVNGSIRPTGIETLEPFNIDFGYDNNRVIPQYTPTAQSLDYSNFFHIPLDARMEDIRGRIPVISVLSTIFFIAKVLDDLQKVLANQGHPRIKAKVVRDILIKNMPDDIRNDRDPEKKKARKWLRDTFTDLKTYLEDLKPDDSLIIYDYVDLDYLELRNTKLLDPTPLITMLQARLIAGLKTLPTLVGIISAGKTQGYADTETLIYLRVVTTFQNIISDIMGKIFTQVLHLLGLQGYVEFYQQPPNLRNPQELAQWEQLELENLWNTLARGSINEDEYHREIRRVLGFFGDPPPDAVRNLELLETSKEPALAERPTSAEADKERNREATNRGK